MQEAFLAMGAISQNVIRDTAVDFSYHSFITKVGFVTKKALPLPKIGAIWWPFSNELWISVGVTVVLFSLGFWIFSKMNKEGFSFDFTLGKSFTQVLKILLMKGISLQFCIYNVIMIDNNLCRYLEMAYFMEGTNLSH